MAVLRDTAGVPLRDTAGLLLFDTAGAEALTERLAPDTILAITNLKDTLDNNPATRLADIDDAVASPDAEWWTAVDPTLATIARVGFATPTGAPTVGADVQRFRFWLRKTPGTPNPTVTIEIWETGGGSSLATPVTDVAITSTTGQLVEATWNASLLSTANGSAVEVRIVGTPGVG